MPSPNEKGWDEAEGSAYSAREVEKEITGRWHGRNPLYLSIPSIYFYLSNSILFLRYVIFYPDLRFLFSIFLSVYIFQTFDHNRHDQLYISLLIILHTLNIINLSDFFLINVTFLFSQLLIRFINRSISNSRSLSLMHTHSVDLSL